MAQRTLEPSAVGEPASRYTMYGEIAAGGMGTVHLGRVQGAAGFARTVAIKRLHPDFASEPEFLAMLIDEARMAACIHHPNVVSTLDVVYRGEELLLVMDYVEGETLARLLECSNRDRSVRAPPLPTVITVLSDVLFGLHAAHTARSASGKPLEIVHRDVSPHNVMVGTDGVARVHDFGIAKAAHRKHSTRPGQIKGKFAYMAPEQIFGLPVDARTDVFAAGIVLWECLAQRRLFSAESPQATIQKVLAGVVSAPSHFNSLVTPELDQVVLKALASRLEDRFATAEEFAEALSALMVRAKRADVGQWVREKAHRALADRARLFEQVEVSAVTSVPRLTPVIQVTPEEPGATQVLNPPLPTPLPSSSIPATTLGDPPRSQQRARSARVGLGIAAWCGIVVLTAALGFASGRGLPSPANSPIADPSRVGTAASDGSSRSGTQAANPARNPTPDTQPASQPPSQAPVVALEALMSEPEPELAVSGALASAPKAARPVPPPSLARKLKTVAVVTQRPPIIRPSCDVPYSVDRFGVRRVRRECL